MGLSFCNETRDPWAVPPPPKGQVGGKQNDGDAARRQRHWAEAYLQPVRGPVGGPTDIEGGFQSFAASNTNDSCAQEG